MIVKDSTRYIQPFINPPAQQSLPEKFTYPFCYQPDSWAQQAALELQQQLISDGKAYTENTGKMYGVLVVKDQHENIGYLCAYSGAENSDIAQQITKVNFVPNIFAGFDNNSDYDKSQHIINTINNEIKALTNCPELIALETHLEQVTEQAKLAIETQQLAIVAQRKLRKIKRAEIAEQLTPWAEQHQPSVYEQAKQISIELSRQSVESKKALQSLKADWQQKIQHITEQLGEKLQQINALKKQRKKRSNKLQNLLFAQYNLSNITGETKGIIELFEQAAQGKPPAGTGDCAAPKLLHFAFQHQLKPICFAEFWWGQPHPAEIRKHGLFYPACQGKCGPLLPFMLKGLAIDDNPLLRNPAAQSPLDIVYQDEHLVVVNKPAGLLSVPGKNIADSVETRIKQQFSPQSNTVIVHRLDMATSGLLVLALTARAHKGLQQQFIEKSIDKRYIALLDGKLEKTAGDITLPLILDINDRPRQKVCREHGKTAKTHWQVIDYRENKTLVQLYPITGRTHQLRVHCAHPEGLNMPITGDGLYGKAANRLHLHAEYLQFTHPVTKQVMSFQQAADF